LFENSVAVHMPLKQETQTLLK